MLQFSTFYLLQVFIMTWGKWRLGEEGKKESQLGKNPTTK